MPMTGDARNEPTVQDYSNWTGNFDEDSCASEPAESHPVTNDEPNHALAAALPERELRYSNNLLQGSTTTPEASCNLLASTSISGTPPSTPVCSASESYVAENGKSAGDFTVDKTFSGSAISSPGDWCTNSSVTAPNSVSSATAHMPPKSPFDIGLDAVKTNMIQKGREPKETEMQIPQDMKDDERFLMICRGFGARWRDIVGPYNTLYDSKSEDALRVKFSRKKSVVEGLRFI